MLKTCFQKHLRLLHVSPCFPVLPHGRQYFRQQNMFLRQLEQKHTLLLGIMFPVWPNWEESGKHVNAANVSGNMFPRFSRALDFRTNLLQGRQKLNYSPWQNEKPCLQKQLLRTHVSSMFPRFPKRETLFL